MNLPEPTNPEFTITDDEFSIKVASSDFLEDRDTMNLILSPLIKNSFSKTLDALFTKYPSPSSMFQKMFFSFGTETLRNDIFFNLMSLTTYISFYKRFHNTKFHFYHFIAPPADHSFDWAQPTLFDFFIFWTKHTYLNLNHPDMNETEQTIFFLSEFQIERLFIFFSSNQKIFCSFSRILLICGYSPANFFTNTTLCSLVTKTFDTPHPKQLFELPEIASHTLREGLFYGDWDYNPVVNLFPDYFV